MNSILNARRIAMAFVAVTVISFAPLHGADAARSCKAINDAGGDTPNKGCVKKQDLSKNAVTSKNVKNKSLKNKDLAKSAIKSNRIKNGAVKAKDLATNSVTQDKVAQGAVASDEVQDNSLTSNDLATNSVNSAEIAAGAVSSSEVANNSLTSDDLATNSVRRNEIASGAVASSEVLNNSLTAADLAPNSVGSSEIASGAVGSSEVEDNSLVATDQMDEAGVDFASGDQVVVLDSSDVVVRSVTITAPTSGYVVATAAAYFRFLETSGADQDEAKCSLDVVAATSNANAVFAAEDLETTEIKFFPFALTRGFAVNAGSTTVYLVCTEVTGDVQVADSGLTAIFAPTRY